MLSVAALPSSHQICMEKQKLLAHRDPGCQGLNSSVKRQVDKLEKKAFKIWNSDQNENSMKEQRHFAANIKSCRQFLWFIYQSVIRKSTEHTKEDRIFSHFAHPVMSVQFWLSLTENPPISLAQYIDHPGVKTDETERQTKHAPFSNLKNQLGRGRQISVSFRIARTTQRNPVS